MDSCLVLVSSLALRPTFLKSWLPCLTFSKEVCLLCLPCWQSSPEFLCQGLLCYKFGWVASIAEHMAESQLGSLKLLLQGKISQDHTVLQSAIPLQSARPLQSGRHFPQLQGLLMQLTFAEIDSAFAFPPKVTFILPTAALHDSAVVTSFLCPPPASTPPPTHRAPTSRYKQSDRHHF